MQGCACSSLFVQQPIGTRPFQLKHKIWSKMQYRMQFGIQPLSCYLSMLSVAHSMQALRLHKRLQSGIASRLAYCKMWPDTAWHLGVFAILHLRKACIWTGCISFWHSMKIWECTVGSFVSICVQFYANNISGNCEKINLIVQTTLFTCTLYFKILQQQLKGSAKVQPTLEVYSHTVYNSNNT